MILKIRSIIVGYAILACVSLHGQDLSKTLADIGAAGGAPEAVFRTLVPWLDENGLDRLKQALDAAENAQARSAADWQSVAWLEESLLRPEQAVKAWQKACASPKEATPAMHLGLAQALARQRLYAESLQALEALDATKADSGTVQQAVWLMIGICNEGWQRMEKLTLPQRLMEQRPDDSALRLLLARQALFNKNPSMESTRQARESMAQAADPQLKRAWQQFVLQCLIRVGRHSEAAREALQVLAETKTSSEEEWQLTEILLSTIQPSGSLGSLFKGTPTVEDVAKQMAARPAVVRRMALSLRESGDTAAALRVLGLIPGDAPAKKLASGWQEEDGHDPQPESRPPAAAVAKVEPSPAAAAPPAWLRDLSALDKPERLKKLLQLWKADPKDQTAAWYLARHIHTQGRRAEVLLVILHTHFSCADRAARQSWWDRQHQQRTSMDEIPLAWWKSQRWRLGGSASYWETWSMTGGRSVLSALREAARLAPDDEAIHADLAEALSRAWYEWEALHQLDGMTIPDTQAAARLQAASMDLIQGHPHAAARTLHELAGHKELTASLAVDLGSGLVAWHLWGDALLFLDAQCRRFPADHRLLYLHALALKGAGEPTKAAELLLQMGQFSQDAASPLQTQMENDMEDAPSDGRYRRLMQYQENVEHAFPEWLRMQLAVVAADKEQELQSSLWFRQHKNQPYERNGYTLTPSSAGQAGSWAMVQLMSITADLPEAERLVWVKKAQDARLPLPVLLAAGKLNREKDRPTTLKVDKAWLEAHLDSPGAVQLWLSQPPFGSPPAPHTAELALKMAQTTLETQAPVSLEAALLAWNNTPESPAALEAVKAALAHGTAESAPRMISDTASRLAAIPMEARRRAKPALLQALTSLSEKVTERPLLSQAQYSLMQAAMRLRAWDAAAKLADTALPAQKFFASSGATDEAAEKTLAESLLAYPRSILFYWAPYGSPEWLVFGDLGVAQEASTITDEERPAFLAAASSIQHWEVKLFWARISGSKQAAKDVVHGWLKAQPEERVAVLTAASLAMAENDLPRALNLLYARMQAQKQPDDLLLAQLDYLMAGSFPGNTPRQFAGEPPENPPALPKAHASQLRQVALKLHPRLKTMTSDTRSMWAALLKRLGLEEADSLKQQTAEQSQQGRMRTYPQPPPWRGEEELFLQQLTPFWARQTHRISTYDISSLLKSNQQEHAIELLVRLLRRQADSRFISADLHGSELGETQNLIRQNALAEQVLKAIDPGPSPSWQRLVQAVHLAEACEAWDQVVVWADAALKLETGNQPLKQLLSEARLRTTGDPTAMVETLKELPPEEALKGLETILKTAQNTPDLDRRLKVAQAMIRLAEKTPAMLTPPKNTIGKAVSGIFELLSDAIYDAERRLVAPALYPDFELQNRPPGGQKTQDAPKPATADQLALRKKLFDQYCTLCLQHTEWMRETLRRLTARQIVDGQPEAPVLVDYVRRSLLENEPQKTTYFDAFVNLGRNLKDGHMRLQLARLALPLLDTVYTKAPDDSTQETSPFQGSSSAHELADLIGEGILSPKHPPLWALWECPLDVTSGEHQHTPEQLQLNKERRAMMDELWSTSEKFPALRRQLFPTWAAYRLHFVDKVDEVLAVARTLGSKGGTPTLLMAFVQQAVQSYENPHHVLSAELVAALLKDLRSSSPASDGVSDSAASIIRVLLKGRSNQADPMPPLSASEEQAAALLSPELQARRRAVLTQLSTLLGKDHTTSPELAFALLEEAVIQNKDTTAITRQIVKLAAHQQTQVSTALNTFVLAANGTLEYRNNTSLRRGGTWVLDQRLRWFSTALDLGRELLKTASGTDSQARMEWLRTWISNLMQSNLQVTPPVPPPNGLEPRFNGVFGSTAQLYSSSPLIKKRDELLLAGMELEMQHSDSWMDHLQQYTTILMARTPPGTKQLIATLDRRCADHPELYFSALRHWTDNTSFRSSESRLAAASLMMKALEAWPKTQVAAESSQAFSNWHRILLGSNQSANVSEVPLLPDMPWMLGYNSSQIDWSLKQPGARERHEAWVRLVDKALTIPGMPVSVFTDAARLHVEKSPEKLVAAARNFSVDDWRQVQNDLRQIFNSTESHASVERRLHWGRLVVQLLPLTVAAEKYSPSESTRPGWASDALKFLKQSPQESSSSLFRAPPPSVAILEERDALIQKLGDMLLDNPVTAVEGLENFAHKQFAAGAVPEATLSLARKVLKSDPTRLGDHLRLWCSNFLNGKDVTTAERLWSLQILLPLAEEWPAEQTSWLSAVASLLEKMASPTVASEQAAPLFERLMDAAMKLPPQSYILSSYSRTLCTTKEGRERLLERLSSLRAKDRLLAATWLQDCWKSFRLGDNIQPALPALDLLKSWPADASGSELEWVAAFVRALAIPAGERDFYSTGWTPNGPNQRPRIPALAPGASAESRSLQQEALQELRRRKISLPWMLPLELRLAGHSSLGSQKWIEVLRPFFAEPLRAQTLAYCNEVADINILMQSVRQNSQTMRPIMPHETLPLHGDASEIIDVSRCLLTAAQQTWLDEATLKPLREKSVAQLPHIIAMAARRTAMLRSSRLPYSVGGVLESQSTEAQALLDAWDTLTAKDRKSSVSADQLPRTLEARIKTGDAPAKLADFVWDSLKQEPAATAKALILWAQSMGDDHLQLPALLASGRLAALLAERWTPELPAPDWLVTLADNWTRGAWSAPAQSGSATPAPDAPPSASRLQGLPPGFMTPGFGHPPPRRVPPEETARYREASQEIIPQFASVLRRFPGCTSSYYFRTVLELARRSGGLPEQEITSLALAHLKSNPHSTRDILLPSAPESSPWKPGYVPRWQHAVTLLLDQAQQRGVHGELPADQRSIIRDAISPEAMARYESLEALALSNAADFSKWAAALMASSQEGQRRTDCAMWILRSASFKKAALPPQVWAEITQMKGQFEGGAQSQQLPIAIAWLRQRASQKTSDLTQDARELLRLLMGSEIDRAKMREALDNVSAISASFEGSWSGWNGGSGPLYQQQCRWAYELMEGMTPYPELFHASLDLGHALGVNEHPGVLAWLLMASRSRIWHVEQASDWQDWLQCSKLLHEDGIPGAEWLLPRDGLAPIWEFARTCHLDMDCKTAASAWLQEEQAQRPSVSRALLLLACQRGFEADLTVPEIEAALSPCRSLIQKAASSQRAALAAALAALQPGLESARQSAPPQSVLHLLPAPAIAPELEALARRWIAGEGIPASNPSQEDDIRFQPFAYTLLRLMHADVPQVPAVLDAAVKQLAKEKWDVPGGTSIIETEGWIKERLGWQLLNTAGGSSGHRTHNQITITYNTNDARNRHQRLRALRLLVHDSQHYLSTLLFSRLTSNRYSELISDRGPFPMTGADLFALFQNLMPPVDHGEGLLLPELMAQTPPDIPTLEQLAAMAGKRMPGTSLAWAVQGSLLARKAAVTGAAPPALLPPESFWSTEASSPAILLSALHLSGAPPPAALRVRTLQAWARLFIYSTRSYGPLTEQLLNYPLVWLDDVGSDAQLARTADAATDMLARTLRQEHVHFYSSLSAGHEKSLGQRVIRPLLAFLRRSGLKQRHTELMQAAAAKSLLPLELLFEEWRTAADVPQSFRDWLPLYFHDKMDGGGAMWKYDVRDFPRFTRKDEVWLAALAPAKGDSLPRLTASLILSALPDDAGDAPSVSRQERVRQRLAVIDTTSPDELRALNRFLLLPGCAEELLPELLPLLRRHPIIQKWQPDITIPQGIAPAPTAETNWELSARVITLWATAEALHGSNRKPWTEWLAALGRAHTASDSLEKTDTRTNYLFKRMGMPFPRQWEAWADETAVRIIDMQLAGKTQPPKMLLSMWDELHHAISVFETGGAEAALGARLALAVGTPPGTEETRKRLTCKRCSTQNLPRLLETAGLCGLNASQKWRLLNELAPFRVPECSAILAAAITTHLVNPAELASLLEQAPPEECAMWATSATDWLDATNNSAACTAFIRKLATLDHTKLPPYVWSQMMRHAFAHEAPDLMEQLKQKRDESASAIAATARPPGF